jgi:ubiquinone/menaquinone biosynthesis C-methylase UbiE
MNNLADNQLQDIQPSEIMTADEIRLYVTQQERGGLPGLRKAISEQASRIISKNHQFRKTELLGKLDPLLDMVDRSDDIQVGLARFRGMLRYLLENGDYQGDKSQLDHIESIGLLRRGDELVDLGSGPGNVVRAWGDRKNPAVGVDISPTFVAKNKNLKLGIIDHDTDHLASLIGEQKTQRRVVLTSLTLDRVADPKQLIRNVVRLAGEEGEFAIASLFPITPYDDEAVSNRLIYTPTSHRLTHTETPEDHLREVKQYVEDVSRRNIRITQLHNRVHTHAGTQHYNNYYMLTSL